MDWPLIVFEGDNAKIQLGNHLVILLYKVFEYFLYTFTLSLNDKKKSAIFKW